MNPHMRRSRALATFAALCAVSMPAAAEPARLPALNVDIGKTSVSGVSSGGYMAVQFEVAHSSIVVGAGIIAGGPYFCAQADVDRATTVCSCTSWTSALCRNADGATDVAALIRLTERNERDKSIDPTANLARHRVFLFSGKLDQKVPAPVMRDLQRYYQRFIAPAAIRLVADMPANHAMPTLSFGNACDSSEHPYINRCRYDAAGEALNWIYPGLHPRRQGARAGKLVQFDQSQFLAAPASHGLDTSGWVYLPSRCSAGQPCRLHVAFHGCQQGQSFRRFALPWLPFGPPFGDAFVQHAGYNEWADTNDIVVLYPQAVTTVANPKGCWDWWGYDDASYATRKGRQIAAVRAMVDRIAGGQRQAQQ